MQFTNGSLLQMLLSTGNIMTLREILNDLLTRPSTREYFGLGLREAPFDVRHESVVGAAGP